LILAEIVSYLRKSFSVLAIINLKKKRFLRFYVRKNPGLPYPRLGKKKFEKNLAVRFFNLT